MERRRWLSDLLARPAAQLLPHMSGHEPLPWDGIKGLGDMFADLREIGAAATRTAGRRRINHTSTRQVVREVPTGRLAPCKALNRDAGRLDLRLVLASLHGQFLELQLHLIEQTLAALGERAKH